MLPGLILFCVGGTVAEPKYLPGYAIIVACFLGVYAVAVPGNLREARRYQRQINELDAGWGKAMIKLDGVAIREDHSH
jgi:hypothetical protein